MLSSSGGHHMVIVSFPPSLLPPLSSDPPPHPARSPVTMAVQSSTLTNFFFMFSPPVSYKKLQYISSFMISRSLLFPQINNVYMNIGIFYKPEILRISSIQLSSMAKSVWYGTSHPLALIYPFGLPAAFCTSSRI